MSDDLIYKIIASIREAVIDSGKEAFDKTQESVPVDTGALKASGVFREQSDGIMVQYAKEYAEVVERGWQGGMVWTNQHVRKGGIKVRGHYKNQPHREGVHFIENSLKGVFIDKEGSYSVFQKKLLETLRFRCAPYKVTDELL